jgi:thiamine pyrophosphate-dependent acetolactate synthase large subunit-like protein
MSLLTGGEILAKSLKNEGTEYLFFLMGGPMIETEGFCVKEGIKPIDVRHEQAAAMMGNAWSRLTQKPSVCMAASGPGVINLCTGIANAFIDCAPMVICGGGSSVSTYGRGAFQDIDQVAIMEPMTKHAERIYKLSRIPEQVHNAFEIAMSGKPGPVYLDFPGDLLHESIDDSEINWDKSGKPLLQHRPPADPAKVGELAEAIKNAKKPLILSGSGVIWSRASPELTDFVEMTGIPFYTTPQGRGVLPDDHKYSWLNMRSLAFRETDLIIVVGTRLNYIVGHAAPPRFNATRSSSSSSRPWGITPIRNNSPVGAASLKAGLKRSAKGPAPMRRRKATRSTPYNYAMGSKILSIATPSWSSMVRKF